MKSSTRKVVTRSPSRTVRILNLPGLLPEPVEAESSYEAAYVLRASLMPACKAIVSQPFKVPASPKDYTPDFLQTFVAAPLKPAVVEIKPEGKVKKYAEIFDCAAEFLGKRDYEFYVITDRELFKDGIDQRVRLIRRYAKASFPETCWKRVAHVLGDYDRGLTFSTLLLKAEVSREAILHYLASRRLTTGSRLMVDASAVVRLSAVAVLDRDISIANWFGVAPWSERRTRNVC